MKAIETKSSRKKRGKLFIRLLVILFFLGAIFTYLLGMEINLLVYAVNQSLKTLVQRIHYFLTILPTII